MINRRLDSTPKRTPKQRVEPSKQESALIKLFSEGDRDAFTTMAGRYYPRLLKTASRILKNTDDAQDAVQDAMLRAYKKARSFRGACSVSTWLTRIVINCSLMQLRKKGRRITLSLEMTGHEGTPWEELMADQSAGVEASMIDREHLQRMRDVIETLDPNDRFILANFHAAELPMHDFARMYAISLPATKSRLCRARATLKAKCERVLRPAAIGIANTPAQF
jgi:RNA polymerase sigma-70 factor (ECF subfamily)